MTVILIVNTCVSENKGMEWKPRNSSPKFQTITSKRDTINTSNNMSIDKSLAFSSRYVMDVVMELNVSQKSSEDPIKHRTKARYNSTRVRFVPYHQELEIMSIHDYTQEEIQNTWYSKNEFALLIKDLDRSNNIPIKRRQNIRSGWMAVRNEQKRQRKLRICDPESMAVVYSTASKTCSTEAHTMALWNELEIWDF
jgi:hypothetical protein